MLNAYGPTLYRRCCSWNLALGEYNYCPGFWDTVPCAMEMIDSDSLQGNEIAVVRLCLLAIYWSVNEAPYRLKARMMYHPYAP